MDYINEYKKWLENTDAETKAELEKMTDSEKQDAFYRCLEFGTGGLRGVMGAGTNRMNVYTVRQATQGVDNEVVENGGENKGVVPSQQKWTQKSFKKRNESQYFVNLLKPTAFIPRFA